MALSQVPPLFKEEQGFDQPWLWGVMGLLFLTALYGAIEKQFSADTFIPLLGLSLLIYLLRCSKLMVEVQPGSVSLRFFPYHLKPKLIQISEIREAEALTYKPILQFGGWGLRRNWSGDTMYNTSGNRAVRITFKNNKKLWIGSQRAADLAREITQQIK